MSMIHYKFRSAKDYSFVTFEGLTLPLFELKRDILITNKLKGADFDIIVSNAQTDEDYTDDDQLIQRNTSVYVRRVPSRPGGTSAQHYLTGIPSLNLTNLPMSTDPRGGSGSFLGAGIQPRIEGDGISNLLPIAFNPVLPGGSEEDKLKALLNQSSVQWDQPSIEDSSGAKKWTNSYGAKGGNLNSKPTSANYVCHRCGIKGHFVQNCPSSSDRRTTQPKVRRTTGIPRSFLKNIEAIPYGKGAMISNDGALVVAQTNEVAWKKHQLNQRGLGISAEELRETAPVPPHLECNVCTLLLNNAVSAPCCKRLFCHECVTAALLDKDPDLQFKCPVCEASDIFTDALVCESRVRSQVDEHLRLWATERLANSRSDDSDMSGSEKSSQSSLSPKRPRFQAEAGSRKPRASYNSRSPSQSSIPSHKSGWNGSIDNSTVPLEMPPLRWTCDRGISSLTPIPSSEKDAGFPGSDMNLDVYSSNDPLDESVRHSYSRARQSYRKYTSSQRESKSPSLRNYCPPRPSSFRENDCRLINPSLPPHGTKRYHETYSSHSKPFKGGNHPIRQAAHSPPSRMRSYRPSPSPRRSSSSRSPPRRRPNEKEPFLE